MSETRNWSDEEDRYLKQIFQAGRTKWSQVARTLQEVHGFKGRNGKQCKERYVTHVNPDHEEEWSAQLERKMFSLHDEIGNKWAIIGCKLGGKSDNCVKNHFYSKLRKALRKLNRLMNLANEKDFKEIKVNLLYKIVEATDQRFKITPVTEKQVTDLSCYLKNRLLDYSYSDGQEDDEHQTQIALEISQYIADFNRRYKKKTKRQRRHTGQDDLSIQGRNTLKLRNENTENETLIRRHELTRDQSDSEEKKPIAKKTRRAAMNDNKNKEIKEEEVKPPMMKDLYGSVEICEQLQGFGLMEVEQSYPTFCPIRKRSSIAGEQSVELQSPSNFFFEDSEIGVQVMKPIGADLPKDEIDHSLFR